VSALAVLILISTMTTGWHYFVDVLGGLLVAVISILLARSYLLGMSFKGVASDRPRSNLRPASVCTAKVKGIATTRSIA
jgi:membrane-associated phospholipid phosphatase